MNDTQDNCTYCDKLYHGYNTCTCAPSSVKRDFMPLENSNDILKSFDAREWAQQFCLIADKLGYKDAKSNPMDEGWMITWFANALMRGYDEYRWREEEKEKQEVEFSKKEYMRVFGGITPKEMTLFRAGTNVGRSSFTEFTTQEQSSNYDVESSLKEQIIRDIEKFEEKHNLKVNLNSLTIIDPNLVPMDGDMPVTLTLRYDENIGKSPFISIDYANTPPEWIYTDTNGKDI